MKRETKVGMTVAGTFLAMAGGALGIRMWKGDAESPSSPPPATTEVVQQPVVTPPAEVAAPPVTPPPDALVNTPTPPVFPPVVTPAAVVTSPPPVPTEPGPSFPSPVIPAPVVPETKPPEPTFPPVVETPKQPEVQPPPPINNDPPKPKEESPAPTFPPVVEPTPAPVVPPVVPPVVETKPDVPVIPPVAPSSPPPTNPEPVANLDPPIRTAGGSPAPLPDAIKSGQPTGVAKPKRPATDSYMEEEYKLRNGDTFATVSKKFCFHEKYAQALQQYNRDYPLASANMRVDPPRLSAGQIVWIPPIRILEKRYPNLIPDLKPIPGQTTGSNSAPATDAPTWTTANSNSPPQPAGNSNGMKTYRVHDGGETMQEIARRTLGNTQAWSEIYRLNPSLNPSSTTPIPAGTLLRMPASAKE